VDFLWKIVGCMKILWISCQRFLGGSNYILNQILFLSCLLRIQIQVDLPLVFQAVNDDSIALTAGKSDVDLLDTQNTHARTNMCSCSSSTQFTCLVSHNFATNNHGQWKTRKRGKQQIRNNFMSFVLLGFIGLQMGFSSWWVLLSFTLYSCKCLQGTKHFECIKPIKASTAHTKLQRSALFPGASDQQITSQLVHPHLLEQKLDRFTHVSPTLITHPIHFL
jgi:hypothetical protein